MNNVLKIYAQHLGCTKLKNVPFFHPLTAPSYIVSCAEHGGSWMYESIPSCFNRKFTAERNLK